MDTNCLIGGFCMKDLSQNESYKELSNRYTESLTKMKTIMNEEQYQVFLQHEEVEEEFREFVKKKVFEEIINLNNLL
jgi:hypothetical protein